MWLWDLDPGISGAIWNGRDLWLHDMRGGLGTVEGNLDFGILRRTQGIERIRVMMGDQSLWILSDLVEIGNSGIRLLDLGGMSITNIKTRFCFYHLVDWINHSWDYLDHFLEIGIWFGSLEEIWDFLMDFFIEILLVLVKQGLWIIMIRRIIWKRYGLNGYDLQNIILKDGLHYKWRWELFFCFIVSICLFYGTITFIVWSFAFFSMTQGQLVEKGGDMVSGEMARKRLKISVPHFDNSDLIKSYDMTLVGRCMNPEAQKVDALLVMLPKFWKVEERVTGADMGMGKFQFHFEREEDIKAVLEMQPYHFDYWMLSLARWQPRMPRNFPSEIPFWIKVEGVPLELWSTETFQSIGDAIGETTDVDLDFGKMRVVLDSTKELCFETEVDFKGGEFYEEEEVLVLLKYDKLFGFCKRCFNLCHDEDHCPLNPRSPSKKKETKEIEERKEERARSYKGVVINGDGGKQETYKDHREYYGKGKGKM